VTHNEIKEFSKAQETSQLNKQVTLPKIFNKIIAEKPLDSIQIDLLIYDRYKINNYQ
jgi:hypothetical protein